MNGTNQCLDAGAATSGTGIVVATCNGAASQKWNVTSNPQNGSFNIMSAATGRCMTVRGNSTAAGAAMETDDCVSGSSGQQFAIQAGMYTGTAGSGGSGSSGGTNPCASYCTNPVNMSAQSFQSGNVGTAAACYQTTFPLAGFQSSNMTGRTFTINGQTTSTLPAKVNGGYCFVASAGGYSYASFSTW
jgi:Ricin-type beta-trefoil lectin domain